MPLPENNNWTRYEVTKIQFKELSKNNKPIPVLNGYLNPNCGVEIFCDSGQLNAIYDAKLGAIRKLNDYNHIFKSMPNRDLILYNDHLLNPNITTIVVDGFYGTGKTSTLCSHLVPGLMETFNGKADSIPMAFLSKPHESLGKTYGHLPGEIEDKTFYEFQSFTQYFERFGQPFLAEKLMSIEDKTQTTSKKTIKKKNEQPLLYLLIFEYLRGRDIDKGWVVLDESQNTNRKEMAAFISRVTDNAKLILIGDSNPTQRDKKNASLTDNGLSLAKEIFRGKKYAGFVEMQSQNHILRGQRVKDLFNTLKD